MAKYNDPETMIADGAAKHSQEQTLINGMKKTLIDNCHLISLDQLQSFAQKGFSAKVSAMHYLGLEKEVREFAEDIEKDESTKFMIYASRGLKMTLDDMTYDEVHSEFEDFWELYEKSEKEPEAVS